MRKLAVLVLTLGLVTLASPANAVWKGEVSKGFPGPDGDGGAHAQISLVVNDNDFQPQIQALAAVFNDGSQAVEVHFSYLKLVRNGVDRLVLTSFTRTVAAHDSHAYTTGWVNNPHGSYWSRTRLWVCWPNMAGDPCGNAVAWNSGTANYA